MKHQNKELCSIVALAATAILAASCAKDIMTKEEFDEGLFVKTTISADATLPGNDSIADADKAYVDGSTRKVIWQSGDQLKINNTVLTVAEIDSGGVRAKFYGTVQAIDDQNGSCHYWALYPKTLVSTNIAQYNTLQITLPPTQTIDPTKQPLEGYSYMAGHAVVPPTASRIHFQMRNLGAVLKLTLTANANDFNRRIDSIVFTSTNANLSGQFNINNASIPTISQGTGKTRHKVTFTGGSLDISSQKTIYVFLPPLLSKNLTMRIYGGYGFVPYVEKTVSSISLNRNTINTYTNANVTFDKVFTVASNRKVIFSPGTLQWSPTNGGSSATTHTTADGTAAGTWRFAPNQYDMIGQNNTNITNITYNSGSYTGSYKGWIDLFGWGTSGFNSRFPWKIDTVETTYGQNANINGTNYDWGTYNAIYNPKTGKTDPPGTWRTLTKAEWTYLLNPTNATSGARSGDRFAKATVNDVKGLIIFPDGWNNSTYPLNNKNTANAAFNGNTISAANWKTLEQNGCVFLPACGYRYKRNKTPNATTNVTRLVTGSDVYCWSGTYNSDKKVYAWHLWVDASQLSIAQGGSTGGRRNGYAVRLVRTHN